MKKNDNMKKKKSALLPSIALSLMILGQTPEPVKEKPPRKQRKAAAKKT